MNKFFLQETIDHDQVAKRKSPLQLSLVHSEHAFSPLASERSALQFSEAIPVGTYIMKVDGPGIAKFTFVSQRFLNMLDLDRQKTLSDPSHVYERVHPEDVQGLISLSEHAQKNTLPFYWEGRILVRGETRWFLCETSVRKLLTGGFIHEGAVTDITLQKRAERKLLKERKQVFELLKNTPLPMLVHRLDSREITFINEEFSKKLGYVESEIPTVDECLRLVFPDQNYRYEVSRWWRSVLSEFLRGGTPIPQRTFQIKAKAGQTLDMLCSGSIFQNLLIISLFDVTETERLRREEEKNLQEKITLALGHVEQTESKMLASLISLARERDNETGSHIVRTQKYVERIALRLKAMGHYVELLSESEIARMVKVAPLHDIGKVGIPDAILKKEGKLDDQEWAVMKTHTSIGERVLSVHQAEGQIGSDVLATAVQIAGSHHEKWDGSGYPRGLKGHEIPLPARIMAVADMYDALVTKRVYKAIWTHADAVKEIVSKRGTHLDPEIVDAFLQEADEFLRIANANKDSH